MVTETCSVLDDLANGTVALIQESYTTAAIFSCDVGFSLLGAYNVTCQTDGSWSDVMPTCGKKKKLGHNHKTCLILKKINLRLSALRQFWPGEGQYLGLRL